jgi:hypothetical protein
MKFTVIFDDGGNIIGLGPAPKSWPEGKTPVPPRPIEGQNTAFIELPEQYSALSHLELYDKLRVDATSGEPKLVPRSGA